MKKGLFAMMLSCCLLLAGCGAPQQTPAPSPSSSGVPAAYRKITAEEAKRMIDAGGVTVVDVRRADEYAQSHIPGALLVPNEEIGANAPEALPDKDAVLLVHCRSGVRSRQAADKLLALGYQNVHDFGGIADWPYETVSGS